MSTTPSSAESAVSMEFIRKLLRLGQSERDAPVQARGAAPVQTQEEQDATRARMETELQEQKDRRESGGTSKT